MSNKKSLQLGMSFSTASGQLYRDIIFAFSQKLGYVLCIHCNKPLSRDTFSIEHVVPWLDSSNAFELFFDIDNISFSHISCNASAARRYHKKYSSRKESNKAYKERIKADPKKLKKYKEARKKEYLARRARLKVGKDS